MVYLNPVKKEQLPQLTYAPRIKGYISLFT